MKSRTTKISRQNSIISKMIGKKLPYNKIKHEIIIRSIKILDMGYLTVLYFLSGYIVSHYVNKLYGTFDPKKQHNKIKLLIQIILQLFIVGVLFYIIRNIIQLIPFPLDGISGFEHIRVKEFHTGGIALTFGMFNAQTNLKDKMNYFLDKKDFTSDESPDD
jgi:hypothetical protein